VLTGAEVEAATVGVDEAVAVKLLGCNVADVAGVRAVEKLIGATSEMLVIGIVSPPGIGRECGNP